MSSLRKELVFLIIQFLNEEGFNRSAQMLEHESGFYFDMKFFEEMVLDGNWEEVESYLSCFTKIDDNRYSTKIYFDIRKQKFLEALDSKEHAKALNILTKDLKVFAPGNEELYNEMALLLTLDDIRDHESLSMYEDTESARKIMLRELKKIIEANPIFHGKLKFPTIQHNRLRRLINQSLNWQHLHCINPHSNPDINTLFMDHECPSPDGHSTAQSTDSNALISQALSVPVSTFTASCNPGLSTLTDTSVFTRDFSPFSQTYQAATLDGLEDYDTSKKIRSGILDETTSAFAYPSHNHSSIINLPDSLPKTSVKNETSQSPIGISNSDFPKTLAHVLNEGSSPVSLDFHPVHHTLLLVGTYIGDIGVWDVDSGAKLLSKNFKVWNIGACSTPFKTALVKDPVVSVNRIAWSPDGSLFGVAYSKHIAQLYSYHGGSYVQQQLEIDAHVGGINDLAFSVPDKQLLVITCGDDKTIKAWDVFSGVKVYSFEGHDAPVYSLCPHSKELIHFIFSTSVEGKIKAWLYDNMGARVDFDAPGFGRTRVAYSADGRRLFSCGTNKDGQSFLVEWDESEGTIKRIYQGLQNKSPAVVQFGISKDRFLAAGDDHTIKIWEMDKVELLTTIDADGLPANPLICFNKKGTLLAVTANENRIKILATDEGFHLMDKSESCTAADRVLSDNLRKLALDPTSSVVSAAVVEGEALVDAKADITVEADDSFRSVVGNPAIIRPSQCLPLNLPSFVKLTKISRLIYSNSGTAILALDSNGVHLLWKWPKDDQNLSGKATTKVSPQLWQPKNTFRLMINDITCNNPEQVVPCFALSKNDSYLISASGGMISLFNMITFKTMTTIMPPAPAPTCLAFYPQDNNIIAIGMDDSTILIYNVRSTQVKAKLEGHSKRITGLAFSNALNVLVSSGADAQISVWNVDQWKKQTCKFLQMSDGKMPVAQSDIYIQFHQDQARFLVVHETQLAIYEAKELECLLQWAPVGSVSISQATFSCDGQMVYTAFVDGNISVFDASNLEQKCKVSSLPFRSSPYTYPNAIAAHPQKPTQFAVGLRDGTVHILEPQEPEGEWLLRPATT